jgi:hypothetical protein
MTLGFTEREYASFYNKRMLLEEKNKTKKNKTKQNKKTKQKSSIFNINMSN